MIRWSRSDVYPHAISGLHCFAQSPSARETGVTSVAIRLLAAGATCDQTKRSRSFADWNNNLAELPGPTREIAVEEGAQLWLAQALGYALKNSPDPPKPTPLRLS
jgi:hypothetical protein